jgi:hypothetical protein
MRTGDKTARRYHWHSARINSFVENPHTGVCGINQGPILNLTASEANVTRNNMLQLTLDQPDRVIQSFQHMIMPSHHDVSAEDVNLKRLGSVLWLAHDRSPKYFEELLMLEGVGPRTIQSLALVSEVIHGSPLRFRDPARFSFAHGGKDGHPFPVPVNVYDETIHTLQRAVEKSKIGHTEKAEAIRKLHTMAVRAEKDFIPGEGFEALVQKDRNDSWRYGGKTVFGDAKPPHDSIKGTQLKLFCCPNIKKPRPGRGAVFQPS